MNHCPKSFATIPNGWLFCAKPANLNFLSVHLRVFQKTQPSSPQQMMTSRKWNNCLTMISECRWISEQLHRPKALSSPIQTFLALITTETHRPKSFARSSRFLISTSNYASRTCRSSVIRIIWLDVSWFRCICKLYSLLQKMPRTRTMRRRSLWILVMMTLPRIRLRWNVKKPPSEI